MLKLFKQMSADDTVETVVKTNEGEFIIHRCEDGIVQIGHEEDKPIKEFVITKENHELYNIFLGLYKMLYNGIDIEDIVIPSSEFYYNESSFLIVSLDEEKQNILVTLTRSTSKKWKNHSWVTPDENFQPIFNELYSRLSDVNNETNQISLLDYVKEMEQDLARTRKILSGKN